MTEEITTTLREFEAARRQLHAGGKIGPKVEAVYAQAYARLVKLGVYSKLRAKYMTP